MTSSVTRKNVQEAVFLWSAMYFFVSILFREPDQDSYVVPLRHSISPLVI